MEKRLGIAQLCLLLAVLVFLSVTRGSPGEFHIPSSNSGGAAESVRGWGRRSLRLSGDWVLPSRLRSTSSGPPPSASQDSHSHTSTSMATTPVSRAPRWPASATTTFLSQPPTTTTKANSGPGGGHITKKAMIATTPTPTSTFRQKRPPPLYLTPTQHHHQHRVPRSRSSTHAHSTQARTRGGGGGDTASPTRMSMPVPVPVQRSSSYGGSFVGVGGPAVPRSARRWARSAHVHEVRRARQHHHHHHHHLSHNHNHNHHGGVNVGTDLMGATGENADVFLAAPSSRGGGVVQSAPLAGSFGSGGDAPVWMRARRGERGDEGGAGAGADTWVDTDTDTDADADDDGDCGPWPWEADAD